MPYNFAADSFHTKKLCSRLSSREVRFWRKNGRFAFLSPPLGDVGATYDDRLRLIGKDFLFIIIIIINEFHRDASLTKNFRAAEVTISVN